MSQYIPIINMNGQTCYSNNKIDSSVIYFRGNNDYINNNCNFIKQSGITMDMDDCKGGGRGAAFRTDCFASRKVIVTNCTAYSNISWAMAFYSISKGFISITDIILISTAEYFYKGLAASD